MNSRLIARLNRPSELRPQMAAVRVAQFVGADTQLGVTPLKHGVDERLASAPRRQMPL